MNLIILTLLASQLNFETYSPPGSIIDRGVFTDVYTHCPVERRGDEYRGNRTTWCHEMVHFVNNRLRNSTRKQCFYLGKNQYVAFDNHPNVTLLEVAAYVQTQDRNSTYKSYLIEQSAWWNKQPLYLLDEWSAYRLDIQCGKEEGIKLLSTDSWKSFHAFGDALLYAVQAKDPHYKEFARLNQFIQFLKTP